MEKENPNIQCDIRIQQACEDQSNIWFPSNESNQICRLDKKAGVIYKEYSLPKANNDIAMAYGGICKWNDYLIVAPWQGKTAISVYHVKEKISHDIWLWDAKKLGNRPKFCMCFPYKNYVYLVGQAYPAIVRLNMTSLEPEYITNWVSDVDNHWEESQKAYFKCGEIIGSTAILPFAEISAVLKLDLETGETHTMAVPSSAKGFSGLTCIKERVCLPDRHDNKVILWEPDTNIVSEIQIKEEKKNQDFLFTKAVAVQDRVLLIPLAAKHVYWVFIETGKVEKCMELESAVRGKSKRAFTGCYHMMQNSEGIYLDFDRDDCFYFYGFSEKQWSPIKKICEKSLARAVVSSRYKNVLIENREDGLEELLQALTRFGIGFSNKDRAKPKAIGEDIYRTLKA